MNTPELLAICYTGGFLCLMTCYWANAPKRRWVKNHLHSFVKADAAGGKAPAGKPEDGLSPLQYCGTVARQRPERRGPRLGSRRDGTLNHRTHRLGRWLAVNNVIQ